MEQGNLFKSIALLAAPIWALFAAIGGTAGYYMMREMEKQIRSLIDFVLSPMLGILKIVDADLYKAVRSAIKQPIIPEASLTFGEIFKQSYKDFVGVATSYDSQLSKWMEEANNQLSPKDSTQSVNYNGDIYVIDRVPDSYAPGSREWQTYVDNQIAMIRAGVVTRT
jgi:hypothetical protein